MATQQVENDPGDPTGSRHAVKRRGLIAGAAALVAGAAVLRKSETVAATDIHSGVNYRAIDPYSDNYVFIADASTVFLTSPADVTGIEGRGKGIGDGVHGIGGNNNGIGVRGNGGDGSIGVNGVVPNHGYGVYGTAGVGYGVYGTAPGGVAVGGDSSGNVGVMGRGGGDTSGNTTGFPIGVRGSVPNNGFGVYGNAGNGSGVYGNATGGVGVNGVAVGGTGVQGTSNTGANSKGVYGHHASNGFGVYGDAGSGGYGVTGVGTNSYGVVGQSGTGIGVYGTTGGTGLVSGLYGTSTTAYGIIGNTTAAGYSGLTAITSTSGVAALGATSTVADGYAAFFTGTTVVNGNFAVTGSKSAAVAHPDGTHRLLYCVESPEAWFEDFGEAKLVNGKAEVKLDADFAALVHADSYHVFPVSHDAANKGLAVTARTGTGFTVTEQHGGTSTGTISWRVVAKRKDNPGTRLEKFAMPKINHPDPDKLPKPELPKSDPPKKP